MAHPLSNHEIDDMLKHLPNYRGCFMTDSLPTKINPNEISVVNLDVQKNPGTHWVLIYNSPKDDFILYIDPFGILPNTKTEKYLKTGGKKILYNTSQIQNIRSIMCGYYCVFFALELSKGQSVYDVIYHFKFDDMANERLIKAYFNLKK